MTAIRATSNSESSPKTVHQWLDAPQSRGWCASSWGISSVVFVGLTILLGGPSQADAVQSAYSALLMAHGDWSCAYPPTAFSHLANGFSITTASPVYTLVTAGLAKVFDIGRTVAFPTSTSLGQNCSRAMIQVANWSQLTNAVQEMTRFGFIAWLVLVGGLVAMLRTSGRGRNGWEAALLLFLACSAPVFACLESFFHPEDLIALGLILFALSNCLRRRWLIAGVILGFGITTQLFTILAIIPLLFIVSRKERVYFLAGLVAPIGVIAGPLAIVTSGRVLHAIVLGTSRAGLAHVKSSGGTIVFSAGLHGFGLFAASRVAPMAASALFSWLVVRRLGTMVREPILLVSLVGLCLTTRLIFEVNVFGYYYVAAIVFLLLLDVLRGRFSGQSFALIWLITLAYSPIAWGFRLGQHSAGPFLHALLPFAVAVPVLGVIAWRLAHHKVIWYLIVWLVLVAIAFLRIPLPEEQYNAVIPSWCWQFILVSSLLYLLSAPFREIVRVQSVDDYSRYGAAGTLT